jgi:hypothetical protein
MKLRRSQQGWTALGVLTVLIVAGIFVSIGFKLAPAYSDNRTLNSMMLDTVRDRALLSESKREIELAVLKRARLNNMALPKDYMKIEKDKGTVSLIVDYEVRVPIFHNVDAVMTFKETYEGQEIE